MKSNSNSRQVKAKMQCLSNYLDRNLKNKMPPWRESHVAVPVVEEVLEQLEELLLAGNVTF